MDFSKPFLLILKGGSSTPTLGFEFLVIGLPFFKFLILHMFDTL